MRHRPRALLAASLLLLAALAGACGALDRGSGLPDTIGDKDREEISEVLTAWIEALNNSDLTTAQLYSLTPGEIGFAPFQRLTIEMSAFTAELLEYEFQGLDSVSIEDDYVAVTFKTNYGPREGRMILQDGLWKLSRLPRMLVPTAEGTLNITWEILREIERSTYERTWLVEFKNESDVPALWNSAWAFVFDEDGNENEIGSAILTTRLFLWPGETILVRIDGILERGRTARSPEIVPVFRRAFESDRAPVVDVSATDVELTTQGAANRVVVTGRVRNPDLHAISVGAVAALYGANGELLALAPWRASKEIPPGESADVEVFISFSLRADDATSAKLFVLAISRRPG